MLMLSFFVSKDTVNFNWYEKKEKVIIKYSAVTLLPDLKNYSVLLDITQVGTFLPGDEVETKTSVDLAQPSLQQLVFGN